MSALPSWLHSQLNSRPPFEQVPGPRVDAWNVATWTSQGLHILNGAHDRSIAERIRDQYIDEGRHASAFVIRGGTR